MGIVAFLACAAAGLGLIASATREAPIIFAALACAAGAFASAILAAIEPNDDDKTPPTCGAA